MATQVSGKRKFVADAAFYAELNEVLIRELAEDGYTGVEVRVTTTGAVVVEIPRKEEASPATYRNKTVNGVFGENHKP